MSRGAHKPARLQGAGSTPAGWQTPWWEGSKVRILVICGGYELRLTLGDKGPVGPTDNPVAESTGGAK